MKAVTHVDAEAVDFSAQHVLFVEGDENSIDTDVLRKYLEKIKVQPLGPASSIRSVAKSLYTTHRKYYFLIDRDHHVTDESIDACWRNFPDPATNNLLIWRRKELENYFLDPALLIQSSYCEDEFKSQDGKKLREMVVALAQKRLYLDAANYVIVSLREELKTTVIKIFSSTDGFDDEKSAMEKLIQVPEWQCLGSRASQLTEEREIVLRFKDCVTKMTGGRLPLEFDAGDWLQMISGKQIYHTLVSQCFQVKSTEGKPIQGTQASNAVARDLLRTATNLPSDLIELKTLIQKRVETSS